MTKPYAATRQRPKKKEPSPEEPALTKPKGDDRKNRWIPSFLVPMLRTSREAWCSPRRDGAKVGQPQPDLPAPRQCTHTGRPLGTPDFVAALENSTLRYLAPRKGGRPIQSSSAEHIGERSKPTRAAKDPCTLQPRPAASGSSHHFLSPLSGPVLLRRYL